MWAIVWKDIQLELRTKERLASFFVLAVLIVLVWIFALGPQQARDPHVGAAVLWVGLLFAGMLSLQRSFLIEQERGCLSGLLLCPIAPSDIFVAKLLGNIVFLSLVQAIVVPITIVLCGLPVSWSLLGLPLIVLLVHYRLFSPGDHIRRPGRAHPSRRGALSPGLVAAPRSPPAVSRPDHGRAPERRRVDGGVAAGLDRF